MAPTVHPSQATRWWISTPEAARGKQTIDAFQQKKDSAGRVKTKRTPTAPTPLATKGPVDHRIGKNSVSTSRLSKNSSGLTSTGRRNTSGQDAGNGAEKWARRAKTLFYVCAGATAVFTIASVPSHGAALPLAVLSGFAAMAAGLAYLILRSATRHPRRTSGSRAATRVIAPDRFPHLLQSASKLTPPRTKTDPTAAPFQKPAAQPLPAAQRQSSVMPVALGALASSARANNPLQTDLSTQPLYQQQNLLDQMYLNNQLADNAEQANNDRIIADQDQETHHHDASADPVSTNASSATNDINSSTTVAAQDSGAFAHDGMGSPGSAAADGGTFGGMASAGDAGGFGDGIGDSGGDAGDGGGDGGG